MGFNNIDANGNPTNPIVNQLVNFGWEYVWHCHLLAHEEMDMMHSLAFAVPPSAPTNLTASITGNGNNKRVNLIWTDPSVNETGFTVQKATNAGFSPLLATFTVGPNTTSYSDSIGNTNQAFYYRVYASNTVGDTAVYAGSPLGFPKKTVNSGFSNTAGVNLPPPPPVAPSNVQVTCARNTTGNAANRALDQCTVTWADNSNNETGFRIQRATNNLFTLGLTTSTVGANVRTFNTGNVPRGAIYYFHVQAYNAGGPSAYVNAIPFPVTTP